MLCLLSSAQQNDSVVHNHVSIPFPNSLPFSYYRILNKVPCTLFVSYLFFFPILNIGVCTWQSQTPNTSFPYLLPNIHKFVLYICVSICVLYISFFFIEILQISDIIWYLSFSDLVNLVWSSPGPSILLQMALFHSF